MVTFIVDEAHCVKKWGENVRREFSNLGEVRSLLPEDVNIMALTATASQATCKQVCQTLGMVRPAYIIKTPDKPNIHLSVKQKLLKHCRILTEQVIIFVKITVISINTLITDLVQK